MDIPLARAMHVTVQQKSIRHKSPRMYHGVYSGGDRRTTSEREREEEERKAASKAFISVALFYFFARSSGRSFVRSTLFSTLALSALALRTE